MPLFFVGTYTRIQLSPTKHIHSNVCWDIAVVRWCLRVSFVVKRHHDHSNSVSNKGMLGIGRLLNFLRVLTTYFSTVSEFGSQHPYWTAHSHLWLQHQGTWLPNLASEGTYIAPPTHTHTKQTQKQKQKTCILIIKTYKLSPPTPYQS